MMAEEFTRLFELCTCPAVLPASLLMVSLLLYGVMVMLGALDFELLDFDLDFDTDAPTSIGFVTLKFFNIGEIPLMIWLSAFGLSWWAASIFFGMAIDGPPSETFGPAVWQIARNLAIGLLLTKAATQPLCKIFAKQTARMPEDLIGQECEISTYDATPDAGQARFPTDTAPLLLNVRTTGETLGKGHIARIVDYDSETKLYLVASTDNES